VGIPDILAQLKQLQKDSDSSKREDHEKVAAEREVLRDSYHHIGLVIEAMRDDLEELKDRSNDAGSNSGDQD
jgi:hypothetical protein